MLSYGGEPVACVLHVFACVCVCVRAPHISGGSDFNPSRSPTNIASSARDAASPPHRRAHGCGHARAEHAQDACADRRERRSKLKCRSRRGCAGRHSRGALTAAAPSLSCGTLWAPGRTGRALSCACVAPLRGAARSAARKRRPRLPTVQAARRCTLRRPRAQTSCSRRCASARSTCPRSSWTSARAIV